MRWHKAQASTLLVFAWTCCAFLARTAPSTDLPADPKEAATNAHWAFKPVRHYSPPEVTNAQWAQTTVDRFILAKLEQNGLKPAPSASKHTLVRRAAFDLTGLPPTPEEVGAFLADESPDAYGRLIERLLASPQYGERWGRHWLDVVRYTDSFDARGIGGEADVPEAFRYRDWVVSAFNSDLPYDQFVVDQIAGDILATNTPGRFDARKLIATGVYVIGEWGTGDADKEKMLTDIVDDQVDVTSRAFLGLTVACARCHDHKFDPISTYDYYAMAGIFFSSHILPNPGVKTAGSPVLRIPLLSPEEAEARRKSEARIKELESAIDKARDEAVLALARAMLRDMRSYLITAANYKQRLDAEQELTARQFLATSSQTNLLPEVVQQWAGYLGSGNLALLRKPVRDIRGNSGIYAWTKADGADTPSVTVNSTDKEVSFITITMPARSIAMHPSPKHGVAVSWKSPLKGAVEVRGRVADADDKCGNGIDWTLRSRGLKIASGAIGNGSQAQIDAATVEVQPGELVELAILPKADYACDTTVVELEILEKSGPKRTWHLTREVVPDLHAGNPHTDSYGNANVWHFHDLNGPAELGPAQEFLASWIKAAGNADANAVESAAARVHEDLRKFEGIANKSTNGAVAALYRLVTDPKGAFWADLRKSDALFELPTRAKLDELSKELAGLKQRIASPPEMVHGLQEGGTPKSAYEGLHDARIHVRGRYDQLGQAVPRGAPAIFADDAPTRIASGSGRLELAKWIASAENPLTARVMVNRIWQHHFGEGLVRTSNNYGKLGEPPSHPELLDYLATQFIQSGWSIKAMHRLMMLSASYRQSSIPARETLKADPENRLLGRMNRRRLESEAIRDSLLACGNNLDLALGGKAIRDFNARRRTLYVITIRSDRNTYQFLFDAADPNSIAEKRLVSTVAPQALFLLNHPFVLEQTEALLARLKASASPEPAARVQWLYRLLYGRTPKEAEIRLGLSVVSDTAEDSWRAYCHSLLCANEFLYID